MAAHKEPMRAELEACGCEAKHLNAAEKAMEAHGLDWGKLLPKLVQALPYILQLVALFGEDGQPKPTP